MFSLSNYNMESFFKRDSRAVPGLMINLRCLFAKRSFVAFNMNHPISKQLMNFLFKPDLHPDILTTSAGNSWSSKDAGSMSEFISKSLKYLIRFFVIDTHHRRWVPATYKGCIFGGIEPHCQVKCAFWCR